MDLRVKVSLLKDYINKMLVLVGLETNEMIINTFIFIILLIE